MTQPDNKKQKRSYQKVENPSPLIINFFQAFTPVLHAPGQWRNPRDESRNYTKPEHWVKLAQIAERGKVHGLFIGDSLSYYGGYKSEGYGGPYNFAEAAKSGNNFPKNDPTAYLSAIAISTKNVSVGITCSTLSEHPYHFARRMATLDHLSGGRVGWNVVTSFLPSAGRQLIGELPDKASRYEKTDEYLQVFYELLLSSWRDDGVVYDKEKGIFSDPDAIREINFDGKYFKVPGPQITEPSPQRIPLIIQAGTSPKGIELGAKHAEVIFIGGRGPEELKEKKAKIENLALEKYGRKKGSIKFITITSVIVAKTSKEAHELADEVKKYQDDEGIQVHIGGGACDLAKATWDEDLTKSKHEDIRNYAKPFAEAFPNEKITRKFVVDRHHSMVIGSPEEVADELEDFVAKSGIDGFNFTNIVVPENFESIVDLLIPELQKRGLAQKEYAVPEGTYREQVYGQKGHTFVPEDHHAYGLKWSAGVSKAEFEKSLAEVKKKQKDLVITASN